MECQATNIKAMVILNRGMERPKAGCGSALSHPLLVPQSTKASLISNRKTALKLLKKENHLKYKLVCCALGF